MTPCRVCGTQERHACVPPHISETPPTILVGTASASWRDLYPTVKQITVFVDRDLPKPKTRGEAARLIRAIAEREGWA